MPERLQLSSTSGSKYLSCPFVGFHWWRYRRSPPKRPPWVRATDRGVEQQEARVCHPCRHGLALMLGAQCALFIGGRRAGEVEIALDSLHIRDTLDTGDQRVDGSLRRLLAANHHDPILDVDVDVLS